MKSLFSITLLVTFFSFSAKAQEYFIEVPDWEEAKVEIYNLYKKAQLNFCDTTDLPDFEVFERGEHQFNKRLMLDERPYDRVVDRIFNKVINKSDQLFHGDSSEPDENIFLKIVSKEVSDEENPSFLRNIFKDCGGSLDWAFEVSIGDKVLGTVDFFYSSVKLGYQSPVVSFSHKELIALLEKEGLVF